MEWQVITDFFATIQAKGQKFEHPNPNTKTEVDFCTYWYESWNLGKDQAFVIPLAVLQVSTACCLINWFPYPILYNRILRLRVGYL